MYRLLSAFVAIAVLSSAVHADDAPADPAAPDPAADPNDPNDPADPADPQVTGTAPGTGFNDPDKKGPEPEPIGPWYKGPRGRKRLLHLSIAAVGGAAFVTSELLKPQLETETCRWCEPPSFDRATRNALVWDNTRRADIISSIDAYVVAPIAGLTLLYLSEHGAGLPRFMDDTISVLETVSLTNAVVQILKFSIGRQRPYARFGTDVLYEPDQNLSFPSGHSALGFSITVAAGMVAHWRNYWTEPYIWGTGIFLSTTTQYLRIAADKHYLSDVLVGGALGIAGGLLIPRLMREDVPIVPIKNGVAWVGAF
ncbi:MAG: phosphatase PAP2 family protein [Myxococcales bacterium]|nr:phosphatase PAP2 family protein [Myxococcales bacterium]